MTSRDANTWERPPQVPDTHFVSGLVYSDDEIFEQERKLIFGKVWSIACHESELPERYSFRTSDYAGTPIIITRGEDNRVRTFVNVCSHRGAKLVTERSGTTERFTCFYHLWTYDTRGACVGIPGDDAYESSGLRIEDCGLREVKTEVKLGLVFINLDDAASPLADFVGDALDPFEQILGEKELDVFHYQRSVLDANWKAWMETNLDAYHAGMHFLLRKTQGDAGRQIRLYPGGHVSTGGTGQKYSEYKGWQDRDDSLALPGVRSKEMRNGDLFPNASILSRGTVIRIDTVSPLSPHKTIVECRGVGIKGDTDQERLARINHHNQYWGPFGRNWPEDAVAAERCEKTFGPGVARYQIIAREQDLRDRDDGMMRAFYAEWSRRMGRPAHNPTNMPT